MTKPLAVSLTTSHFPTPSTTITQTPWTTPPTSAFILPTNYATTSLAGMGPVAPATSTLTLEQPSVLTLAQPSVLTRLLQKNRSPGTKEKDEIKETRKEMENQGSGGGTGGTVVGTGVIGTAVVTGVIATGGTGLTGNPVSGEKKVEETGVEIMSLHGNRGVSAVTITSAETIPILGNANEIAAEDNDWEPLPSQ